MDTSVALVSAYLRFNGYVVIPEQPILLGEGRPWRYHTATDVDILAVRFPNAAVVVPRSLGGGPREDDDLRIDTDEALQIHEDAVDVIIAEVKEGRPKINPALLEPDVLYAILRRVDPGFDEPIAKAIRRLIEKGETTCKAGGRMWRFRLMAFGNGEQRTEPGSYSIVPLERVMLHVISCMETHRDVWRDVQFGDPVLDMLHLLDKLGLTRRRRDEDMEQTDEPAAAPAGTIAVAVEPPPGNDRPPPEARRRKRKDRGPNAANGESHGNDDARGARHDVHALRTDGTDGTRVA